MANPDSEIRIKDSLEEGESKKEKGQLAGAPAPLGAGGAPTLAKGGTSSQPTSPLPTPASGPGDASGQSTTHACNTWEGDNE